MHGVRCARNEGLLTVLSRSAPPQKAEVWLLAQVPSLSDANQGGREKEAMAAVFSPVS